MGTERGAVQVPGPGSDLERHDSAAKAARNQVTDGDTGNPVPLGRLYVHQARPRRRRDRERRKGRRAGAHVRVLQGRPDQSHHARDQRGVGCLRKLGILA